MRTFDVAGQTATAALAGLVWLVAAVIGFAVAILARPVGRVA
jgi:hypothetical protein